MRRDDIKCSDILAPKLAVAHTAALVGLVAVELVATGLDIVRRIIAARRRRRWRAS